jgi:thymidylate synthase (FAD)
MEFVEIKVHHIASTHVDRTSIRKWLDEMGAQEFSLDDDVSDSELLIGLAAKRCYKSYVPLLNPNVTKVRAEWSSYFRNLLQSGHGSVLEHSSFTYAFENVSRVFTAEMNRHRAGVAISEQSLRYVRFHNIPFWLPFSLRQNERDSDDLLSKKRKTREILRETIEFIERQYGSLVNLWDFDHMGDFHTKKVATSLLRRIIPLGVATGAVYTMNGRAIRHICTMRCDPAAEEEICYVFSHVAKDMVSRAPLLFGDFKQTPEGFWCPEFRKV